LQKRQHQPAFAGTGAEAVRLWREGAFDLILMDVQLPEMDGVEASRLIMEEARRVGKPAVILGLTAHASPEDQQRCLEAGMAAYIAKPVQPRDLLEAMDRLLR
jgi:CheY-like chemotaxis protein